MSNEFEELANKRRRWVDSERENGADKGMKRLLTELYPDNAHFIYELLQNAEDAQASIVRFILNNDGIEFEHNGKRLFSIDDIESITNIGTSTKRDDGTSIGKFGVGFKAVFAYTNTPEIKSGKYHFRIHEMRIPETVCAESNKMSKQTSFILPFDNPKKSPQQARNEVEKLLNALDATTLLFLTHIRKIEYLLPDSSLGYIERIDLGESRFEIRVEQPNQLVSSSTWFLKFDKEVKVEDEEAETEDQKMKTCRIAVAFGLSRVEAKVGVKEKAGGGADASPAWELAPMEPGRVCIYFPADKETSNLRFHLHAPFASTVARDSVRDCEGNNLLRDHLADLLAESMPTIRDQGLLSVQALALLPNDKDNLGEFYQPLMERLVEEFQEKNLVPMKRGGHATADGIFRGSKALSDLIGDDDMVTLLGEDYVTPIWALNPPQRNQREDNFLSMLDIKQWGIAELVEALNNLGNQKLSEWMADKDDKWHQALYEILMNYLDEPYRYTITLEGKVNHLARLCLIPCSDHEYRKASDCFFPASKYESDSKYPRIAKGSYCVGNEENKEARRFLETIGVREADIVAEVIEYIIPKYESAAPPSKDEHFKDIDKIIEAFQTDSQEKQKRLKSALKKTPFILSRTSMTSDESYRRPHELYFSNESLEIYFSENSEVGFVSSNYKDAVLKMFENIGVRREVRINKRITDWHGFIIIDHYHSNHKRGISGFDPDIEIEGLSIALSSPTREKSLYIWNKIVMPNAECIRGTIEKSTRQFYENSSKEERISDAFGRLLIESKWLPGLDGQFHRPSGISIDELPDQFERNGKLADLLGMKKNLFAKLAQEAGVKPEILEYARNNPQEIEKLIAREVALKERPTFPTSSVVDPERREERLREQLNDAPDKEYEKRERSVRTTNGAIDPITWLRNQYTNEADEMICQICKEEMPFRKRDGDHYFEKKEVLKYLPKEHEAQYLALCPLCAAKYDEFVKTDDEVMAELREKIVRAEDCVIPISLGDEKTSIRFVETHLYDLKNILLS